MESELCSTGARKPHSFLRRGVSRFLKFHQVEIGVEVGLEVGETGDKAIKRLQEYPDVILNYAHTCKCTHTHATSCSAFTETPWHESHLASSSHRSPQAWLPPWSNLKYTLSSSFSAVVNPNGLSFPN